MARRFEDLLDLPVYESAARIAERYLDLAAVALKKMRGGDDEEALHDFRVSLRRLRSNLQAYEPHLAAVISRKQRRKVRELASATGAGRDAEVHVAWLEANRGEASAEQEAGVSWVLDALRNELSAGYGRALAEATRGFADLDRRLRKRLGRLRRTASAAGMSDGVRFGVALGRVLPEYAAQLDVHLSRVHSRTDTTESHRARIRAKRLRYLLEPVRGTVEGADGLVARLKELQDFLGDLRDARLLEERVLRLWEQESSRPGASAELEPGVRFVLERLRGEQEHQFHGLREEWLGGRSSAFFGDVESVGAVLGATWQPEIEIERKYLLSGLPPSLEGREFRSIEQGYLPGDRLMERVRRIRENGSERFVRSVKMGSGIRRLELQEETNAEVFRALWPLTEGRRLTKKRYRVPDAGLVWEVDDFADRALVIAEIEIPTEDMVPVLPDWLAPYVIREVTGEAEYVNVNLAR